MRVVIFSEGPVTTGVRFKLFSQYFNERKIITSLISPLSWSFFPSNLSNLLSILIKHDLRNYLNTLLLKPDIVIIGKTATPQIYFFIYLLKKRNIKVIFDLDDAMFLPDSLFLNIPVRSGSYSLEKILKIVDYVTVNGHYLYNFSIKYNSNVTIIHDPIDLNKFGSIQNRKITNKKFTIGWEGLPSSHYENLPLIIPALKKLSKEYDIKLKIVSSLGDKKIINMFSSLESTLEIDYGNNRYIPYEQFIKLLTGFDVILAPLKKTFWNEGKSALRVGMAMALNVPCIASNVGEQKYLITNEENGLLVSDDDFYPALKQIIINPELRSKLVQNGKKTVENDLSLKKNAEKLISIFKVLLSN